MVVLLASGVVPPAVGGLLGALGLVVGGVLRVEQAYRAVDWTTVVLIGAMIPLSTAMVQTGAADQLALWLVAVVGDGGPYLMLAGVFLLTAGLGQLISNTATALIVVPIGLAAAADTGISPLPVLMSVTVAAAAALLTPIATPANMMVYGPAGYRFGDYCRLGLPLLAVYCVVAVFLVPVFWPF
jgi:di/tricarboxylate transporter